MKELIEGILSKYQDANLSSEAARKVIANEIAEIITEPQRTDGKEA